MLLPKSFEVTMTVTVKPDAVPAAETVRAWLPIPRLYPHQKDFKLQTASPTLKNISAEDDPIRSAYLEGTAVQQQLTKFQIEYTYTTYGVHFNLKPEKIVAFDSLDPLVRMYTAEGPHVVFTEKVRKLSQELAGDEPNPLRKAKRFYDWITENIQYSYALEYSTIRNISEYCLTKRYGDCGQAALLFITLCRSNGIPARWQSGWLTMPGRKTIHDWTEIHIPPYGWIPVDPYMGVFAMRYMTSLQDDEKHELRDFYFGGLDQYRMAANSDHNQTLTPPKQSLRSDNVDFQRGELEYGTTNLYFDTYSFSLTIKETQPKP